MSANQSCCLRLTPNLTMRMLTFQVHNLSASLTNFPCITGATLFLYLPDKVLISFFPGSLFEDSGYHALPSPRFNYNWMCTFSLYNARQFLLSFTSFSSCLLFVDNTYFSDNTVLKVTSISTEGLSFRPTDHGRKVTNFQINFLRFQH